MKETIQRTPERRLGAIFGLIGALGVVGFLSIREAWYAFGFQAPVLTLPTLQSFTGASASELITGWDLMTVGTANGVSSSAVGNIGGIPTPMALLGIAVLVSFAAWRSRSSLLAVAGLGAAWFAHQAVATAATNVENPVAGGQYMTRLAAMNRFDLTTLGVMALCGVLAAQIVVVKRQQRVAQIESGEDVEPTLGEVLSEIHIGRMLKNMSELSRERHDSTP